MINLITIRGERRSGTNWLQKILKHTNCTIDINYKFGWKHGFFEPIHYNQYHNSDLIIVLFKDVYSWLLSLNDDPKHMPWAKEINFSKFVRHEYYSIADVPWFVDNCNLKKGDELREYNLDGIRFKNIIQLRNAKYRDWLNIRNRIENVEYILYDDLLKNPDKLTERLRVKYKIESKPLKLRHFEKKQFYLNKEYMRDISKQDKDFIDSQIDSKLEQEINLICKGEE
ncbi:MAG: hypothetical protein KAS32_08475 [Candidatus Peribacteraceae bacterium]|nr:hypothetical protein [Candidatus Peribacteraceae bacterium]